MFPHCKRWPPALGTVGNREEMSKWRTGKSGKERKGKAREGRGAGGHLWVPGSRSFSGDLWACRASVGCDDFPRGLCAGAKITPLS